MTVGLLAFPVQPKNILWHQLNKMLCIIVLGCKLRGRAGAKYEGQVFLSVHMPI
jgi:hypothetical protein